MKVVEIWDFVSLDRIKSYYYKDGKNIAFDDNKPYTMNNAISSECFVGGPQYTIVSDGSYFIAANEYDGVPPVDPSVDVVLYANERVGLMNENYEKYSPDSMRKIFPNAAIVARIKEIPPHFNSGVHVLSPGESPHRQIRPERPGNRIRFFNECDYALVSGTRDSVFCNVPYFQELRKHLNKELIFIPGPIQIDYMYNNFYSDEKSNSIFAYAPTVHERRSDTIEFANYIGEKYGLEVFTKPSNVGTLPGQNNMDGMDFTKMWSKHLYNFNLDPLDIQPGLHGKQVASVGSINIGGNNDSHKILFPKTANCDWNKLEEEFSKYHTNEKERFAVIENAWNKLNEVFSPEGVSKEIKRNFLS